MSENEPSQDNLVEEFRKLGKNLVETAHAAWNHPEREKVQKEIEMGLTELGESLNEEYEHLKESPPVEKIKLDINDIRDRVKESETEEKIRNGLLTALHQVNQELENLTNYWKSDQEETDEKETTGETEEEISEAQE